MDMVNEEVRPLLYGWLTPLMMDGEKLLMAFSVWITLSQLLQSDKPGAHDVDLW